MSWLEDNFDDIYVDYLQDMVERERVMNEYYSSVDELVEELKQYKKYFNPKYKDMVLDIMKKVENEETLSERQLSVLRNTFIYTDEIWEEV